MHDAGSGDDALGWGVSAGGKIAFGPDKRHDIRFSGTYGDGIGRYLGLGYAPDAVFDRDVLGNRLLNVDNFAGFASLRLGWTGNLRSTFAAGYQHADYPDGIVVPGLANVVRLQPGGQPVLVAGQKSRHRHRGPSRRTRSGERAERPDGPR